jgi:Autophagy protein Apg9.
MNFINYEGPQKVEDFLSSQLSVTFLRRTVLHSVTSYYNVNLHCRKCSLVPVVSQLYKMCHKFVCNGPIFSIRTVMLYHNYVFLLCVQVYLLQEMLSPVITPFILCFHLRSKSLDIVDFYRNFTVEVVGVGDVCSFAQMDVRRHGNPAWQTSASSPMKPQASGPGGPMQPGMHTVANQYMQVNVCLQYTKLQLTTCCMLSCPFLKSFLKIASYGGRGVREE